MRIFLFLVLLLAPVARADWSAELLKQVIAIDEGFAGNLGVYVKRLGDGSTFGFQADRPWYLSSATKVPIAIAVLKWAERGKVSLDEELTLKESDYVDGSGDVNWAKPGARFKIRALVEKMLSASDSTATDMLYRRLGAETVNALVKEAAGAGFGPITSLIDVRYAAYGSYHPRVRALSNMVFFDIKKAAPQEKKRVLAEKLGVKVTDLPKYEIEDAFEAYYKTGANSAPLTVYGRLLERLTKGELLNKENTRWVRDVMEKMVTGEKRLKAGLPPTIVFAQKTGTQIRRMCNVGFLRKRGEETSYAVTAVCAEKFPDPAQAEAAFVKVGQAFERVGLFR